MSRIEIIVKTLEIMIKDMTNTKSKNNKNNKRIKTKITKTIKAIIIIITKIISKTT